MTKESQKIRTIAIKDLILWDENPRFPDKYFNQDEATLIGFLLSKVDFKMRQLIESIVRDFDLPQSERLIVWNDGEKNIVLEGNRRLASYKLLCNPSLTTDEKIRDFIQEEKLKINISDNFNLECIVVDKEDAFRYIDRKHYNGNNEVNWKDIERSQYSKRRGSENTLELIKVGVSKIVKELDLPEEMKEQILGSGYVTTFFRIITTGPAKKEYGYSLDENGELFIKDKQFKEKLKVIIYSVLNKKDIKGSKIDSRSLNKNKEIEEFLKSVKSEDVKEIDKEIERKTSKNLFGEKNISLANETRKPKVLPVTTSRKYLIPSSCRLTIEEPKINNIYRELRDRLLLDDSLNNVPNAVGVLFRVFLEISLDYYSKRNQNNFKKSDTISQKIPWVVNKLIEKGYNKEIFNNINKVGSAKKENTYLSIDNFHEYVHSSTTQPSSSELKLKWDNLQPFFETLWGDIKK